MIKRFHVLYVGQIELDNIGRQGTPANDRRYPNEQLSEVFWTARDVARHMDELGYYAFWTAEHHFQREGYECLPNLIQLGLWLATQTQRLKFGCAFNILPMWHPIRLAEDYAMADIVTDGRVIMGVGRGYHTREVETFGAPLLDAEANRELFEEQLQLLIKCFNEESFHHKGKYYECPPPSLSRLPASRNYNGAAAKIFAGRDLDADRQRQDHRHDGQYGLKAMVTLNGEKILDDVVRSFHAACLRHGRAIELGQDMVRGAGIYLADSREEAIRRLEPSHDERYKWFAPFGFVRYADEEGRTWGTPGAPGAGTVLAGRRRAEGVVLRTSVSGNRGDQIHRGKISGPGRFHYSLGRRLASSGVQRTAEMVRGRGDAGLQSGFTLNRGTQLPAPNSRQRVSATTKAAEAAAIRVTASGLMACGQRSCGRWKRGLLPTKVT